MKVILKESVKKLGEKGAVVNVSDGYARNFLFKQKLADPYNEASAKSLETEKKNLEKKEERLLKQAKEEAEKLSKHVIKVKSKAGEGGRLFGSITTQSIAEAIKEQAKFEIHKRNVMLEDHIKELGRYEVNIKLHPKVTAKIKFEVVQE